MSEGIFQFSGGRELVNEEKVEALLSSISVTNPSHIRLSNKSFDNAAAHKIATYLSSLSGVEVADISDIIAGRPEEEALQTLRIVSSSLKSFALVEVDVSDNAMGAKGVEACRDILCGKAIQRLFMCNDGLSAEACRLVADILLENGCPPLQLLNFYNNMSGSAGAIAVGDIVRACPDLKNFRFSATRSGAEGCLAIAQALASVTSLRVVDLSDNNFGDEAAESLAESLKLQINLERLNLRDDSLGQKGILKIFKTLKETVFSNLVFLDLSGNEIDSEVMENFSSSFVSLSSLETLLIDDNEFGTDGVFFLYESVKSNQLPSLTTLSCCSCEITSKGAYLLARAVSKQKRFLRLELNGNQLTERAVEEVKNIFNQSGKILGDLDDNDEDGEDDLESVLDDQETDNIDNNDEDELVDAMKSTNI